MPPNNRLQRTVMDKVRKVRRAAEPGREGWTGDRDCIEATLMSAMGGGFTRVGYRPIADKSSDVSTSNLMATSALPSFA